MAGATVSTQTPILKRLWGNKIHEPFYKRCKLAMLMQKDTGFGGEGRYVVVDNSPTAGASASYATAVANEAPSIQKRFFVTRKSEFATFKIAHELMQASKGDKNAMVNALMHEADKARYAWSRGAAAAAWGNGGGSLARISASATISSATILLREAGAYRRFEPSMVVVFANDDGAGASPGGTLTGTRTVLSVDKDANSVTFDSAPNTISGLTVNSYIFREGDYANKMTGIPGWHPTTAPSPSESFFGVDRTVGDTQRNYGLIYDSSADTTYRETLTRAVALGDQMGIEATHIFVAPTTFAEIGLEVTTERHQVEAGYTINFSKYTLYGAPGEVTIVSDPDCQVGSFWALNPSMLTFRTAGEAPMEIAGGAEGGWLEKIEGEAAYRGSLGSYGNYFSENPGWSIQGVFQ